MDEWLLKWNRVCPICKREIVSNQNLSQPNNAESDSENIASTLAVTTDNASDTDVADNIPLLVTVHAPPGGQTDGYGSIAERSNEGIGGQYLLESAMHTSGLYQQRLGSSSESSDGLPENRSDQPVMV